MLPHPDIYRAVKSEHARDLRGAAVSNKNGPRVNLRAPFGAVGDVLVRVRLRRKPTLVYRQGGAI
jgi:hypothetical protein